jgi:DNA-binding MarR family transcriptional regulator
MYRVETWDNKETTIKRLSKYEKRILCYLIDGDRKIKTTREKVRMPHRSSMSRVIKTLESKGLILARPGNSGGEYTKRISLTPAGKTIAIRVWNDTPVGELDYLH